MSDATALRAANRAFSERTVSGHTIVAAFIGLVVGVAGFAIAAAALDVGDVSTAAVPGPGAPVTSFPARELPPEWQWSPSGVDYEHMYRNTHSQRLDWIR